jgi:hypothetical protein
MNKIRPLLQPPAGGVSFAQDLFFPAIVAVITGSLFWIFPFRVALYFAVFIGCFGLRYPFSMRAIASHPWIQALANFRGVGILLGTLLFFTITAHSNPAIAQIFNEAEKQTTSIFGQYLSNDIIPFLFGSIRVVIWVSAVGFVFFAIYQAQRGEQWQPLAQNAFIIVTAVVLVEGLSSLFFGGGTGGTGDTGDTDSTPADGDNG